MTKKEEERGRKTAKAHYCHMWQENTWSQHNLWYHRGQVPILDPLLSGGMFRKLLSHSEPQFFNLQDPWQDVRIEEGTGVNDRAPSAKVSFPPICFSAHPVLHCQSVCHSVPNKQLSLNMNTVAIQGSQTFSGIFLLSF